MSSLDQAGHWGGRTQISLSLYARSPGMRVSGDTRLGGLPEGTGARSLIGGSGEADQDSRAQGDSAMPRDPAARTCWPPHSVPGCCSASQALEAAGSLSELVVVLPTVH